MKLGPLTQNRTGPVTETVQLKVVPLGSVYCNSVDSWVRLKVWLVLADAEAKSNVIKRKDNAAADVKILAFFIVPAQRMIKREPSP